MLLELEAIEREEKLILEERIIDKEEYEKYSDIISQLKDKEIKIINDIADKDYKAIKLLEVFDEKPEEYNDESVELLEKRQKS